MALKDGRGYGDSRECYQDSDPSILNATGRVHQVAPNREWLEDVWPFVRRATERILSKVDRRGLVVAPLATGNFGDEPTITNGWDTINFGHYDAYSNVETYRAFRNVIALARAAGDHEYATRVTRAAAQMKKGFAPCFYNPKTGWFGSWRSKDGELHDYGHHCIIAPACLYGLVSPARARQILGRMEAKRLALGIDNFRYGLPSALIPVRRGDHMHGPPGWPFRDDGADSFGIYCNGTMTLGTANYYIRAMGVFGFKKVAEQMAREILEGHALGRLVGGVGSGVEFHTHEGIVCGYEGAYVPQFPALLAIAQNKGWVKPLNPEFWAPS
jgi:hypothetical protein